MGKGTRLKGKKETQGGHGAGDSCGLRGCNYGNENSRSSEKSWTGLRVREPRKMSTRPTGDLTDLIYQEENLRTSSSCISALHFTASLGTLFT